VPNNFPFSLSFRAASAASNLLLTIQFVRVVRTLPVREIPFPTMLGASVPAHAGTDYARTAWCAILSRFVRKGEAIPCGGHSCPRDPIPDDVGASVLARAPLTIVILEEAESCARAGLPTKDLRISGLPRMLRRNLVQSKPGTARLLVLEPALSDPKGAEQLPFLIVIPSGFSREESAADDLAGTKVPQVRTPLLGAILGRYFTSQSISASAT